MTLTQFLLPVDEKFDEYTKVEGVSTNPTWGKAPNDKSVTELINSGVINLDKPANPTSHEVASWVRKILRIKKTGHGGTLDPQVTGCLPVTLGVSTKAVQVLLPAGKEYIAIGTLHGDVPEEKVRDIAKQFVGKIYQMPPVRSSVKRQLRTRTIYYIDVMEVKERFYLMRVGCQAGTYIRKLCADIGMACGVGGHMKELRRTRSGPFNEDKAVTLHDLNDAAYYYFEENNPDYLAKIIQPIEDAMIHIPYLIIRDTAVDAICRGASLTAPGIVKVSSRISNGRLVVIKTLKGEAVALGTALANTKDIIDMDKVRLFRQDRE